jgi:hypothetical protein
MNTSPDKHPDSLTLTGHRQWSGLWFGVAAMGASSGIIMVGGGAWAGWFLVIVFVPCAIVLGMSLRPSANELTIDSNGYTLRSAFRSRTVPWAQVERIGTIEGAKFLKVAIRLTAGAVADDPESAAVAQALGGYHRTLPLEYAIEAGELASIMRSYAGIDRPDTDGPAGEASDVEHGE